LINDPFFKHLHPEYKDDSLKKASKTLLVHSEIGRPIRGKDKWCDIIIWEPTKTVGTEDKGRKEKIGIEVKFDRTYPARRSEKSGIISDVKKAGANRKGYVLWLNWRGPICDKHIKRTENLVKLNQYGNVKLLYLDMFSDPIKKKMK
jgi:hypothetical protein